METKLTLCPFCGGNVVQHYNHISGEHAFECDDCGALTLFSVDLSPEEATGRFNSRPVEAKLRAACQAAHSALLPHVEFSGEETEMAALEQLEAALNQETVTTAQYYYITNKTFADFAVFWCKDGQGYTRDLREAGLFTEEQIKSYRNPELLFIPVEQLEPEQDTIMAVPSLKTKNIYLNQTEGKNG